MPTTMSMSLSLASPLIALVALLEVLVCLCVLHASVGRAMRARGMARWGVGDTALVSPLLLVGLFLTFAATNHALVHHALGTESLACVVGLTMAWFGARAIAKLY